MKKYYLLIMSIAVIALFSACNKNAKVETQAQNASMMAAADTPRVFKIGKVDKPTSDGGSPNFEYIDNGQIKNLLAEHKGKVLFINFWGTWCPPCRKEIPDIIKLQKTYSNIVVVGIALERDQSNAVTKVSEFASKQGINYMNIIGNEEVSNVFGGINAVPTTFIVDKNGKLVEKLVGMMSYEQFESAVKPHF